MTPGSDLRTVIDLAGDLEDGDPCSEAVHAALSAAVERRRGPDGSAPPAVSPLVVRRHGLPDWWGRDNLLLTACGATPNLSPGFVSSQKTGNVCVVGADVVVGGLAFAGAYGLTVVGDRVRMMLAELAAMNGGTILIGEDGTAVSWARVDARNGGAVLVGADALWENDVNILTDDMHAIRDLQSGRRTNSYGGRIVIDRHVWLCERVRLSAGAHVGQNSVVGLGATVRTVLPEGSVCVGLPAQPIRQGVTWTRADMP